MIWLDKVRWILGAVIFITFCVQWISCRAVYLKPGQGNRVTSYDVTEDDPKVGSGHYKNAIIVDHNHKHLNHLKVPNPSVVEKLKKRIKARNKGRRPDQSNERNVWTSHPKNDNWSGPDTDEVYDVRASLGI